MPHILLDHSMFLVWYPNQPDLSLWMLVYGQVSKTIVYCQHSCNHLCLFQYAHNYQKWPTDYLGQLLSMWSTECCVSNFLWKWFFFPVPWKLFMLHGDDGGGGDYYLVLLCQRRWWHPDCPWMLHWIATPPPELTLWSFAQYLMGFRFSLFTFTFMELTKYLMCFHFSLSLITFTFHFS